MPAANGSRWANLARALRSRNYRLFFMGQGLSLIGTWMQRTALLWLISTRFPDERIAAFWLGVVGFSGQIPALVLTPLAGVWADRWNRRRLVIATQVLAMTQAFALAALTLTGLIEIWHIIALSFCLGAINAVDIPVRQSFVVEMVDRPEDLTNAIALNSSIVNAGRLLGPALGGVLTALFGVGVCFLLNGFSFLTVIAALLAMRLRPRQAQPSRKHALQNLAEGFGYAFRFPPIRALLLIMALVSLAGMPYASLLPAFAKHVFGCGPKGYGILMAGVGVGALVGALCLACRSTVRGLGRLIALAPALLGAGLIAFALGRSFALALILMPLLGLGQMLLMASCNTVLQTIVDDDKRGRVMSFYSLSFMGMVPLGNLLAGVAARQIGPALTVAVGGAVCIAGALNFRRKLPALRKLVHPIYVSKGIIIPAVAAGLQAAAEQTGPAGEPARPQAAAIPRPQEDLQKR
ncbi:MAG: MFS transporter [Sedimentisphaerales bacterium]|nr:MFS transporter [Sedimentisphaerales bacterium]